MNRLITRRPHRRAFVAQRRMVSALAAMAIIAGCGDDSNEPARPCERFDAGPELSVGPGATPTFTWAPSCLATSIYVVRNSGPVVGQAVWHVETPGGAAGFPSGQVYGTTPPRANVRVAPAALEAGQSYIVSIYIDGAASAVRAFTR